MEPDQALHRALDQIDRIAGGLGPDQLDRPTPCAGFDVGPLLNHTTASLQGLADAASGRTWDMGTYSRDLLGDDPVGSEGTFGPPVPVPADATAADRLAGFMGRTP
jgi:hypothetical protein